METTETECVRALRRAAERLGESPTKAEYETLGVRPASATIVRVMGGWNAAKEAAGLETYEQGGSDSRGAKSKPDDVDLPDGRNWEDLTPNMRWYYRNRERDIAKKDRRRARLRRWLHEYKHDHCSCRECGESDPACLDFHHVGDKDLGVSKMVTDGYSAERIREEIERCVVLCANCHRKEHYDPPPVPEE